MMVHEILREEERNHNLETDDAGSVSITSIADTIKSRLNQLKISDLSSYEGFQLMSRNY
jgi:hypothetical protein